MADDEGTSVDGPLESLTIASHTGTLDVSGDPRPNDETDLKSKDESIEPSDDQQEKNSIDQTSEKSRKTTEEAKEKSKDQSDNKPKKDKKDKNKPSEPVDYLAMGLCPAVAMYGPTNVEGLQEGELRKWCTCGISKTQPWCDGAHHGTGFRSLKWLVPRTQSRYEICNCKHTKTPPFCDGTHTNLPELVLKRQAECPKTEGHVPDCKLCTGCGWVPDF